MIVVIDNIEKKFVNSKKFEYRELKYVILVYHSKTLYLLQKARGIVTTTGLNQTCVYFKLLSV